MEECNRMLQYSIVEEWELYQHFVSAEAERGIADEINAFYIWNELAGGDCEVHEYGQSQ